MIVVKSSVNFIIKNGIIFLLTIMWCNFYITNRLYALIVATILTLVISFITKNISENKESQLDSKNISKQELQNFKLFLKTATSEEESNIMDILLTEAQRQKNYYIYKKNILCVNFMKLSLQDEQILDGCKAAKNLGITKIIIFCNDAADKSIYLAKSIDNFEIEIYKYDQIFNLLKKTDYKFQNNIIIKKSFKLNTALFFEMMFSKKNAKSFIILGILTYFLSFISFSKLYYYICASILLIFGLICLFRKKSPTRQQLL